MEIEEKPVIPHKKVSEHLEEVIALIDENQTGEAMLYLEWIIEKVKRHKIDEDIGSYLIGER